MMTYDNMAACDLPSDWDSCSCSFAPSSCAWPSWTGTKTCAAQNHKSASVPSDHTGMLCIAQCNPLTLHQMPTNASIMPDCVERRPGGHIARTSEYVENVFPDPDPDDVLSTHINCMC